MAALNSKRGATWPLVVICALCCWIPWNLSFSFPKKVEPRSTIKPRNALSLEGALPVAPAAPLLEAQPGHGAVISVKSEADLAEVLEQVTKKGQILVVDYYAPWCRACQKLLRYVHKIAPEPKFRNVQLATVDFDASGDLVKSRQVDRLPTMEIYAGQDLKQRWSGANTRRFSERLENAIDEFAPDVVSG